MDIVALDVDAVELDWPPPTDKNPKINKLIFDINENIL